MDNETNTALPAPPGVPLPLPAGTTSPRAVLPLPKHLEPDPWPEPVDARALLDQLTQMLQRFVVLPKWAPETLALWILHTYAFQLRDVTTYLAIESPEKRCGKTTLLTLLNELVHRPVVAANVSSPAFFRVIQELQPTLRIDEADTFLQGNDALAGILNAGYSRKTAYVLRVVQAPLSPDSNDQNSSLATFSCWCPKVLAAIGHLPDTLADRCVILRMARKTSGEACERLRQLDASPLRRQCARFVLDHGPAIAAATPDIPGALNDRAADIWEPLLVLADLAGPPWPDSARRAAGALTAGAHHTSPIGTLLMDIYIAFALSNADRLFSRSLLDFLTGFPDRPWLSLRKGRDLTETWLAEQLRPYGVRPRNLRINDFQAKGYLRADLSEVFRRYIPASEFDDLKTHPALLAQSNTQPPAAAT